MPCPAPAPEEVSPASVDREGCLNSARRSFRPFSARSNNQNADGTGGGDDVEQIGGGVGGGVFNRSLGSSLSAVSDNGSAGSMQGKRFRLSLTRMAVRFYGMIVEGGSVIL